MRHEGREDFRGNINQAVVLGGNEEQTLFSFSEKLIVGAEDLMLQCTEFAIGIRDSDFHGDDVKFPGLANELVFKGAS